MGVLQSKRRFNKVTKNYLEKQCFVDHMGWSRSLLKRLQNYKSNSANFFDQAECQKVFHAFIESGWANSIHIVTLYTNLSS